MTETLGDFVRRVFAEQLRRPDTGCAILLAAGARPAHLPRI